MKELHVFCATSVVIFFYGTLGVYSRAYSATNPSFLSKEDLENYDVFSESLLVELEGFSNKVLDKLAERFAKKFEKSGLNLNSKDNVRKFLSFLEEDEVAAVEKALEEGEKKLPASPSVPASAPAPTSEPTLAPVPSPAQRKSGLRSFFSGVKKAATSAGKEVLVHASKAVTTHALKETLPDIEKLFADAFNRLSVDLKIVLAPLFYNLWKGMFTRLRLPLPPGFTIKNIIFNGLSEEGKKKAISILKRGRLLKLEDLEGFKRYRQF